MNDVFSVGLGGRFWHMQANGHTHFENHIVGVAAVPQVVNWKTDNYGVFLQSSVKLGRTACSGAIRTHGGALPASTSLVLQAWTPEDQGLPGPAEGDTSRVDSTA